MWQPDNPNEMLAALGNSWKLMLGLGVVTFILGLIVMTNPVGSLLFVAILVGVEFVVSGIFRIVRGLTEGTAGERVLWIVAGLLLLLVGLYLIRDLRLTLLLMATLVGVFWLMAGVTDLVVAFASPTIHGRGWLFFNGALGILAGIVVLVYPVNTLLTLAILLGIWLLIRGIMQIATALAVRRHVSSST